jgi:CelD/BcsL family acetyltransferase involved in cellulose biosynthesis
VPGGLLVTSPSQPPRLPPLLCPYGLVSTARARRQDSPISAFESARDEALLITVLDREADFDAIREEWDQLASASGQECLFFLRWHWNRLWWRMYAPPDSSLFVITCRDLTGRLVGVAPFYRQRRSILGVLPFREIRFLGTGTSVKISEHLDIIACRGYEQQVGRSMAAFIRAHAGWNRLWLWGIHADSPVLPHFQQVFGERATTGQCDRLLYVSTNVDWTEVKSGFGNNLRKRIDYYIRHLKRDYEFRFCRVDTLEQVDEFMALFVGLHQERWEAKGERGSFSAPDFKRFLHEVVRDAFPLGRARLWMLSLDGRCVGTLVCFLDDGVAHYFQGGFASGYNKYHLGSVMLALAIQDCIEDVDVRRFDFMGGGGHYKKSWAATTWEAIELEVLSASLSSRIYTWGSRGKARLSPIYRSMLPTTLRSAIRERFFRSDST